MLDLYHKMACPFSKKVRDFIEENELESQIRYHDIEEDPRALVTLEAITGKEQVPCLMIDGRPILESDDIIKWLKTNLVDSGHGQVSATQATGVRVSSVKAAKKKSSESAAQSE